MGVGEGVVKVCPFPSGSDERQEVIITKVAVDPNILSFWWKYDQDFERRFMEKRMIFQVERTRSQRFEIKYLG